MKILAALAVVAALASPTAATCEVTDATLTWGFKESFRSYISGSIANGQWTVSDGATYTTPSFGFAGGTGEVPGAVSFAGAIEFTGHDGILDTTIANPQLLIEGRSATLLLDVSGTTQEGAPVDERGVSFATVDLSGGFADAPATLTADGAAAFGTYPEGEPLDPLTVTLPEGCSIAQGPQPAGIVAGAVGIAAALLAVGWWWRRRAKQKK